MASRRVSHIAARIDGRALPAFSPQRLGAVRSRLLDWYDLHGQEFPWRTERDPYAALVAAVCAQQTQMPRVLATYARWMAAFPTVAVCAAAPRSAVLRVWERAGYPRRAVALHESARCCVERHRGRVPREEAALLALPGVGPFTAAIVRCFGFGDDVAAVDTNVVRVIGRLVCGDLQPARETPAGVIETLAARLLRPGTAARWNPALMDYGARVCTARPRCEVCVLASLCAARPRFAAGERAEPVRAQPAYAGSDRQWRGRILQVLRRHGAGHDGMPVAALWRALDVPPAVRDAPATPADVRPRLGALLAALVADGLAWVAPAPRVAVAADAAPGVSGSAGAAGSTLEEDARCGLGSRPERDLDTIVLGEGGERTAESASLVPQR